MKENNEEYKEMYSKYISTCLDVELAYADNYKNYLLLEKLLFELVQIYHQTQNNENKNTIKKLCSIAKNQIDILLFMLKIGNKDTLKLIEEKLNEKKEIIINIEKEFEIYKHK